MVLSCGGGEKLTNCLSSNDEELQASSAGAIQSIISLKGDTFPVTMSPPDWRLHSRQTTGLGLLHNLGLSHGNLAI